MPAVEYRGKVRDRDVETSWDAAARQDTAKVELVKTVILTLLSMYGPSTDETLVERFEAYVHIHPAVPHVTPQSIRTRRKALEIEGKVIDTGQPGRSRLGNRATVWAVTNA